MKEGAALKGRLYTEEEIAEYLQVSIDDVELLVSQGDLAAYRINSALRFKEEDIEQFLNWQRVAGEETEQLVTSPDTTITTNNSEVLTNKEAKKMQTHSRYEKRPYVIRNPWPEDKIATALRSGGHTRLAYKPVEAWGTKYAILKPIGAGVIDEETKRQFPAIASWTSWWASEAMKAGLRESKTVNKFASAYILVGEEWIKLGDYLHERS